MKNLFKKIFINIFVTVAIALIAISPTFALADGTITVQALGGDGEATITITATGNSAPVSVIIHYGTDATSLSTPSTTIVVPIDSSALYQIEGLQPSTTYYYTVNDAADQTVAYTTQSSFSTNISGQGYGVGNGATAAPTCAAGPDGYCLLAPLGGVSVITDNQLDDYFGMIYKIAIGIAGTLAIIMIFFGGVQYMTTEAIMEKQGAKDKIKNAIIGLILALSSYAILNTVNPNLLDFTFGINKVSIGFTPADIDSDTPHTAVGGKYCIKQNNPSGGKGFTGGEVWGNDTATRSQLSAAPINASFNNSSCTSVGQSGCTSATNLNTSGVQKLRTACPSCEIIITGGTECWLHSASTAHGQGSSIVDLRNDSSVPNLKAFVEAPANLKGTLPGWGTLYVVNGIEFVNEGNHYHVWGWNSDHEAKYPQ